MDFIYTQNYEIDKLYRARSQNLITKADFDMITFCDLSGLLPRGWMWTWGWDSALDAVLDALSDDTNPARNCPLGAEIWLIYWKNEELEISRKSCESIILLSVFGKVAGTLTQIFLYEKMRLFTLYKMSQSLDWALSKKYRKRVKNHVTTDHKMDGLLWCNDSWA